MLFHFLSFFFNFLVPNVFEHKQKRLPDKLDPSRSGFRTDTIHLAQRLTESRSFARAAICVVCKWYQPQSGRFHCARARGSIVRSRPSSGRAPLSLFLFRCCVRTSAHRGASSLCLRDIGGPCRPPSLPAAAAAAAVTQRRLSLRPQKQPLFLSLAL